MVEIAMVDAEGASAVGDRWPVGEPLPRRAHVSATQEIVFGIVLLIVGLALEYAIDVWRDRRSG